VGGEGSGASPPDRAAQGPAFVRGHVSIPNRTLRSSPFARLPRAPITARGQLTTRWEFVGTIGFRSRRWCQGRTLGPEARPAIQSETGSATAASCHRAPDLRSDEDWPSSGGRLGALGRPWP
jgi:hypothetical protein